MTLSLFEGFGIEVERMIVHSEDLSVFPVGDRVLFEAGARLGEEVVRDRVRWSNELVLHVIELKTNGPRRSLAGLAADLGGSEREMEALLAPLGGRLLPGAMHPFMNPLRDARLWPHEYGEVYRAYDRIFGTRTHGFANLQSVHVNLPFASDREFERLHAAVRLVLPLLPAIAASSPIVDGEPGLAVDERLFAYLKNQRRIPSITASVVPERIRTEAEYEERILRRIAADVSREDRDGVLEPEWVNSRGAIARFSRGAVEIRVIDAQECAVADVAVAHAAIAVVRALTEERLSTLEAQHAIHESRLLPVLLRAATDGEATVVTDPEYLLALGMNTPRATLAEVWAHLDESVELALPETRAALDVLLRTGTLSRRILGALGDRRDRGSLVEVYRALGDAMRRNTPFLP